MKEPKILVLVMPGGEVRIEWDEDVHDLCVKLALARAMQLDLSAYTTGRALSEGVEKLPPPADVVGFANRRVVDA